MKWVVIDIDGVKETHIETDEDDPTDEELLEKMHAAGIRINGKTVGFGQLDDGSISVYDDGTDEDLYTIEPEDGDYDEDY
jgi:hypothetical protein